MMPKVSVVIPTYNEEAHVGRAIDSVLNQTYRDLEVVVVDDGSTDDTERMLSTYGEHIRVIRQENGGVSAARNAGIRKAGGEFVALLDADDYWLPEKLERQMKLFEEEPGLGLVFSQAYMEDEHGKRLGIMGRLPAGDRETVLQQMFWGVFVPSPTPVIRKEGIERVGGFDESLRQGEDWDFHLRFAAEYELGFIEQPLAGYRVDSTSSPFQKMAERGMTKAHLRIIEKVAASGRIEPEMIRLARGITWLKSGLLQYGMGDREQAGVSIRQAFDEEPELLRRYQERVTQSLATVAAKDTINDPAGKKGASVLKGFWELLDPQETNKKILRKTLGSYYADRFFGAAQVDNRDEVFAALKRMLWNDPTLLRNRGVWSIGLRAGGKKLADFFQREEAQC